MKFSDYLLKVAWAPLSTPVCWMGTDPTTGDYMGPPSNFYLNLQYIVHTVACDSPSWWSPLEV
ncbi:MAG: hypothetical protein CL969_03255 [Euryarchaeota archaeon]|nr:hypothetical protein [Euryarchaeota archaeon]